MKTRRHKNRGRGRRSRAYSPLSPLTPLTEYPDVESAVFAFHEMTKNLDYEICATITTDESMGAQLILHNKKKERTDDKRNSCDYSKGYTSIILHNHPDKYYPSIEDLEKIVTNKKKNAIIRESYITCKFGIWMFLIDSKHKLTEEEMKNKHANMKKKLNAFYWATEKGRTYNAEEIKLLCSQIHDIYNIDADFIVHAHL